MSNSSEDFYLELGRWTEVYMWGYNFKIITHRGEMIHNAKQEELLCIVYPVYIAKLHVQHFYDHIYWLKSLEETSVDFS